MKQLANKPFLQWVILIAVAVLLRLPVLSDSSLMLDGDECVVGLMSKHFAEGQNLPIFFYGQEYGFSSIEVVFIRCAMFLFDGDLAVRIGMLMLFLVGLTFQIMFLRELIPHSGLIPLVVSIIFASMPVWIVWSMKARGGYLTAFVLTSLVLWLIARWKTSKSEIPYFVFIGLLLVLIKESQALFLLGVLPILLFNSGWWNRKRLSSISVGIILGTVIFYLMRLGADSFWSPNLLGFPENLIDRFTVVLHHLAILISGSFLHYESFKISTESIIWISAFAGLMLTILVQTIRRKKINKSTLTIAASFVITLFATFLIKDIQIRYYLPLSMYACLLMAVLMDRSRVHFLNDNLILAMVFCVLGWISILNFTKNDEVYEDSVPLVDAIEKLNSSNVNFVFCRGGLLQWQLMFYSDEQVIARYLYLKDRYPDFPEAVNTGYISEPDRTAFFSRFDPYLLEQGKVKKLNGDFVYKRNPSKSFLEELGFELISNNH